jgi:Domain of unknown function (DUF4333)
MRGHATKLGVAVGIVIAAAVAAGCGSDEDPTVDPAQIEPQLVNRLSADAGVNPDDVSLACPSGEPAEEGHEFECTLTAPNGDEVRVEVTVTDVETSGDEVNYHVESFVPPGQFK